jgi:Na+/H+ antiporter NhaD/arsenite permease-like protein
VSAGLYIDVGLKANTKVSIIFLLFGALLSNFIGTMGASVLLIKPYLRLHNERLKPYHIVFFIFIISNIGGFLTPIGDPPLYVGFLKGVPFTFTITSGWHIWILAMAYLLLCFYFLDRANKTDAIPKSSNAKIVIYGKRNIILMLVAVAIVFLTPALIDGIPFISFHGKKISFLRELLQLLVAALAYFSANKDAVKENDFSMEPMKEAIYLFLGIFITMCPVVSFIQETSSASNSFSLTQLYWITGLFSSWLDNAPTYITFFTHIVSSLGVSDLQGFIQDGGARYIMCISVASVFFGAATYVGNGPNFVIKSIADKEGIHMPGFLQCIFQYSLPVLLPLLLCIWYFYFR